MGVGGQHHASAALPPGKVRYPLYRRLGGPHGWYGRVRKILLPPGFDPQTVQPVATRYADWAIAALVYLYTHCNTMHGAYSVKLNLQLRSPSFFMWLETSPIIAGWFKAARVKIPVGGVPKHLSYYFNNSNWFYRVLLEIG